MKKTVIAFASLLMLSIVSCTSKNSREAAPPKSQAQEVVDKAIAFHGFDVLANAHYSFSFRDKKYTYDRKGGMYEYTRTQTDTTGSTTLDKLNNNGLTRYINNEEASITEERRAAFSRSVNSVLYFASLPYGLNDAAVKKKYLGKTEIKGKTYHEIEVTFAQKEGGEDFDDQFLYWFDTEDYSMDYLAYLYHVDGGGIRFRAAINPRRINGLLFQDYINLKPEDESIDLMTIDELYNEGKLVELSRIINKDIVVR